MHANLIALRGIVWMGNLSSPYPPPRADAMRGYGQLDACQASVGTRQACLQARLRRSAPTRRQHQRHYAQPEQFAEQSCISQRLKRRSEPSCTTPFPSQGAPADETNSANVPRCTTQDTRQDTRHTAAAARREKERAINSVGGDEFFGKDAKKSASPDLDL